MSMSEFDKQENSRGNDFSSLSTQRRAAPEDFTEEDLAFAEELKGLFSPEDEELPPYYAQTLLEAEDPRFDPAKYAFELRTNTRVFRKLELRRRLFSKRSSPRQIVSSGIGEVARRRSFLLMIATFMMVMLFTVAFTGESFASGMMYLLQGGGSGVFAVLHYPDRVAHPMRSLPENPESQSLSKEISFFAAQQQLRFPMYWPQHMPQAYSLQDISFYQGIEGDVYPVQGDRQWADGPIVQFEYDLPPTDVVQGTGQIVVLEFKPRPGRNVVQMVQDGAAHPIEVNPDGQSKEIYVDGQWIAPDRSVPQWVTGGRSELIYQQDGVVFWIVGDQRDGIHQKELVDIAGALQALPMLRTNHIMQIESEMSTVTQVAADVPGSFANDVIVVNPDQ